LLTDISNDGQSVGLLKNQIPRYEPFISAIKRS
jgi:hypothetical protein